MLLGDSIFKKHFPIYLNMVFHERIIGSLLKLFFRSQSSTIFRSSIEVP